MPCVFPSCRYLHSHCNIPAHDSYMWHGNIRCIQGKRVNNANKDWKHSNLVTNHVPSFASPIRATQQHAAWIIPFFCYQIFDFALNTLVAISVVVYPNTVQDYLQQLVRIPPTHTSFIMSNAPVVNFFGRYRFHLADGWYRLFSPFVARKQQNSHSRYFWKSTNSSWQMSETDCNMCLFHTKGFLQTLTDLKDKYRHSKNIWRVAQLNRNNLHDIISLTSSIVVGKCHLFCQ